MKHQREHWGSRLGFILAAIGSAIGLGTLWKFPYVTGENGGGVFVLIYLGCTVFIGIPVLIAELLLGRRAQRGAVGIFATLGSNNWKIVGWLAVLAPLLMLSYYHVVAGWGINYIFLSLTQFWKGKSPQEIAGVFDTLYRSGGVCVLFQFIFTAIVVGMVVQGLRRGIEKWAKVMVIGLFVLLVALLIFSSTLSGFGQAVRFVFYPDMTALKPSGILTALGLAFFTLSLGHGVMLTYGSYMQPSADIPTTALIVGATDVIISVLAALMIFPIIFTFGFEPDQQFGLIFKTLPVLFAKLPGTIIISLAFFVMFVFTALTSAIAILEVIVANSIDLWQWSRKKATLIAGAAVFILGIPSALSGSPELFKNWPLMYQGSFFATVDALVSIWLLPTIALLTAIFVGFRLKRAVVEEEFKKGCAYHFVFRPWLFFIRWVVPVAILAVMAQEAGLIDFDKLF